ncbi:MAG: amidohydrolase family protein [Planctomycetota bacterium]
MERRFGSENKQSNITINPPKILISILTPDRIVMLISKNVISSAAALILACSAVGSFVSAQDRVIIKGARIIPVSGPEIEVGSILIENGKIVDIGKEIDTPYEARIIDGTGKVVFPGFVDAHFVRGIDRANEAYPVTPFITVADSIDGSSFDFEDALRDGITTINVIHGNAQPIAGRAMVVRPIGKTVENMAVVWDGPLKMSFIPRQFSSHVAQFAEMRRIFGELQDYLDRLQTKREDDEELKKQQNEEEAKKDGAKKDIKKDEKPQAPKEVREEEEIDRRKRTLVDLTKGRVPVFVACNAAEIPFALDFAKKHGFFDKMTLVLGADAWKMVDIIAASGRPVVLDAELVFRERDPITGKEIETPVAPAFTKKGVKFALQTARTSYSEKYLNTQAAAAVRSGIERDAALKSITLWPAEILGLADRVGSIEKGRDANILILSGDPLSTTTFVEKVLLEGQLVYERDKDERLKRLTNISEDTKKRMSDAASKPAESKPAAGSNDEKSKDK